MSSVSFPAGWRPTLECGGFATSGKHHCVQQLHMMKWNWQWLCLLLHFKCPNPSQMHKFNSNLLWSSLSSEAWELWAQCPGLLEITAQASWNATLKISFNCSILLKKKKHLNHNSLFWQNVMIKRHADWWNGLGTYSQPGSASLTSGTYMTPTLCMFSGPCLSTNPCFSNTQSINVKTN